MAIEQQAIAEALARLVDQPFEGRVVGMIEPVDPPKGLGEAQLAAIDLLPVGDDLGDGAQTRRDPWRAGVDIGRQGIGEHVGVKLERFPVGIEKRPGEQGPDQRRAEQGRRHEDLIDEAVLRLAEREGVQPGRCQELRRV